MRFVVIYLLLAVLIYVRGIMPVVHERRHRLVMLAAILPGAFFPTIARFVGGSMVAPDLPAWLMVAGSLLQNFTLLTAVLIAAREAVSVPLRILGLPFPALGKSRILAGAIVTISASFAVLGLIKSVVNLEVVEQTVYVKNLPAQLEGFRIAQISDMHVSAVFRADRVREIVKTTNELHPDLIAVTGDQVDGTPEKRGEDLLPLKDLKARYGVYAIEGNHEHYVDYEGWRRFFPTLGLKWLANANDVIDVNGAKLAVIGLTDPMAARYGREMPDIDKALTGVPADVGFRLLLSHQPKYAPRYVGKADLMLSGHTHGGQITPLYPVVSKLNEGFVKGLYPVGDLQLYVNQGTDVWIGLLLRIGTVDEITLLTLKKAP